MVGAADGSAVDVVLPSAEVYMRRAEIWPKFIATSQHIETVLKKFDDE